jgi:hypothetical protein
VEFIGIELAGGAGLAPSVEKAVARPVEKVEAGPCTRDTRGGQEARWRERKAGCRALA